MDNQLTIALIFLVINFYLVYLTVVSSRNARFYMPISYIALGSSMWNISNYFADRPSDGALTWNKLSFLFVGILVYGMLNISMSISSPNNETRLGKVGGYKVKEIMRMLLVTIAICIFSLSPFVVSGIKTIASGSGSIDGVLPVRGLAYPIYLALLFISIIFMVKNLLIGYLGAKRVNDLQEISKYRILLIGTSLSVISGIVTNIILAIYVDQFYSNLSQISASIMIGSIVYAIARYKLFDIKTSAFRAVGYTFAIGASVFGIMMFLLWGVLSPLTNDWTGYPNETYFVSYFSILLIGWLSPKFINVFNKVTYPIFYRNNYNPVLFAEHIAEVVTSNPNTTDLQRSILKLFNKAYSAQYIQIVVNQADDEDPHQTNLAIGENLGRGAPAEILNFYNRLFFGYEQKHKYVLRAKLDFEEGSEENKLLDQNNIGMITKLKLNKRLVGYIIFGEKTSGTLYTPEDANLVRNHYSEISVALQNSVRYSRIKQFNLELQEKINVATFKLKKSNARLRKLDRAKDDFLSIASHQLRTPLTVVRGNIDLVANGDLGPITKEAKGVLVQSERSAGRLSDLINDFLSTSRLKTGKFILTPSLVNLKFTVEQQIEQLIDFAAQRGIELVLHKVDDNLPVINADEEKLRQVMLNTIDNAIYYSSRHSGKVDVMLYSDGDSVVYKVKDNGIGVPAAEKAKLFSRMYRAENAKNARPDGNGLGLFLMKKIVDAHNGEIIFESKEGEGSVFGFRLAINPSIPLERMVIT
jgi:signal transduction histidine kinase